MDPLAQEEEDRRLRAEAEGLALSDLAAPRRVELAPDPELDAPVAAGPSTDPADYEQDYQDALAAHGPMPEEDTDLTSGVAGVDGIHDYDYEALPREEVAAPTASPYGLTFPDFDGRVEPGNIDLHDRPIVHSDDGSYSTLLSSSAEDPDRGEVLYPGVADDGNPRVMGDDEAWREFERTGQHLGVFGNRGDADAYAERIHNEGDAEYGDLARAGATRTTDPRPDAETLPVDTDADSDSAELMGLQALDAKPAPDPAREAEAGPPPRLDDGLPSEERIASERDADPFRHILHNIGNALRVAGGRQSTGAYEDRGDALEQQRATGMESRLGAKREDREADAEAAESAAGAQRSADLAERGLTLRERMAAAAEQTAASTGAAREASTAHLQLTDRQTQEQREAMTRADSSESQSARRAWQAGLARLPDGMRARYEAVISPEELAGMNATQLEGPLRMLERISVGARGSGSGGGGGPSRAGTARDVLRQHLVQTGLSEEAARQEVDALDDAHVQSRIAAQQALRDSHASRAGDEEGRMVVYGDAEGTPVTADARTFGTPAALNNYQEGLASAGDTSTSLAELERVYNGAIGSGSGMDRAAAWARFQISGEVDQPIGMLMGAVTEMARTGVINPGAEASRIRGMLPDPSSLGQMTNDQFRSRMQQFRSALAAQVTQRARMHGISEGDTNRLLRTIIGGGFGGSARPAHGGSAPAPAAPAGREGMVRVRLPDGRTGWAPRASVPSGAP